MKEDKILSPENITKMSTEQLLDALKNGYVFGINKPEDKKNKALTLEQLLKMSLDEKIQAYKQGYILQDDEITPIPADQFPARYGFMNSELK